MDANDGFRRFWITKMCRLFGIVASELTDFGLGLTEAPRCLAKLSREHRDGWGIAIHHTRDVAHHEQRWLLHKGTEPAADDSRFHELAARSRGHLLVAHIRQKTVGPTRLENTHPFVKDGWVFAHNGTIQHQDGIRAACSGRRLREITGDTDSELFFAYVLTRMDEHGLVHLGESASSPTSSPTTKREDLTHMLHELTAELRAQRIGAFNFLLSDGHTTFAHRFGRSLFVLERAPGDPVREVRPTEAVASITTKWTARRKAILIASERTTDEPWQEIDDGTLLRIDRSPVPEIVTTGLPGQRVAS